MESSMRCLICRSLELAFEAKQIEYNEAGSLAYFQVSKKFAAYLNVEMERARTELEEHRLLCLSAANEPAFLPVVAQHCLAQQEELRSGTVKTAA
jgi:hypothetical protein